MGCSQDIRAQGRGSRPLTKEESGKQSRTARHGRPPKAREDHAPGSRRAGKDKSMNDKRLELVPREDFARWLASDEPAARLRRWMVFRLPALGLGEATDGRLEAIYGFESWRQPDENAWFWGVFEGQDGSGLRRKPEAGPVCLHDRATGRLYHALTGARSLFEPTSDWEKTREPEKEIVGALHDRAKAIVAERLAEPTIREQALKAFDDKGDEVFPGNELLELMRSTFVASGGSTRISSPIRSAEARSSSNGAQRSRNGSTTRTKQPGRGPKASSPTKPIGSAERFAGSRSGTRRSGITAARWPRPWTRSPRCMPRSKSSTPKWCTSCSKHRDARPSRRSSCKDCS